MLFSTLISLIKYSWSTWPVRKSNSLRCHRWPTNCSFSFRINLLKAHRFLMLIAVSFIESHGDRRNHSSLRSLIDFMFNLTVNIWRATMSAVSQSSLSCVLHCRWTSSDRWIEINLFLYFGFYHIFKKVICLRNQPFNLHVVWLILVLRIVSSFHHSSLRVKRNLFQNFLWVRPFANI